MITDAKFGVFYLSDTKSKDFLQTENCVKSIHIPSFSGPHFPAFGLNTEIYSVNFRIHSQCGKMRTRKTPNTDTFYETKLLHI